MYLAQMHLDKGSVTLTKLSNRWDLPKKSKLKRLKSGEVKAIIENGEYVSLYSPTLTGVQHAVTQWRLPWT